MVVTRSQMIQCELNSNQSVEELMEKAGQGCAYALMEEIHPENSILILCGKGNNGGDGFVIARILLEHHYHVQLYLAEKMIVSDAAKAMADRLPPDIFVDEDVMNLIDQSDVIVDCIYGFSFHGQIRHELAGLFDAVNQSDARVFSIDINSGLEADTGHKDVHTIHSHTTLVLGYYKIAHLLQKDHQCFEKLKLIELDLPSLDSSALFEMNASLFKKLLPVKSIDSYKNVNGRTLCIAGSNQTIGAALLCAQAAWKTGIGYLHLASEKNVLSAMVQSFPVTVTHDVADSSITELLHEADSVVIGCGCDHMQNFSDMLLTLLEDSQLPVVADAYALRVLSENLQFLDAARCPVICTPHLGEFSALCSCSVQEIKKNKLQLAKDFATEHGVILVLKGPHTIVASSDGRIYINQTGHQNLAKAGSGDVLAGLIAGFCAQQIDPFEACCMAVWMHGRASDLSPVADPVFSAVDLLKALELVYL